MEHKLLKVAMSFIYGSSERTFYDISKEERKD
jgi:hypothetical protein